MAYRIWHVDRKTTRLCDNRKSELRPVLLIIVDAGAIYSITLIAALVCYIKRINSQYIVVDMVSHVPLVISMFPLRRPVQIMPIISITFYMIIIRVGLANRKNQTAPARAFGYTSSGHNLTGEPRSRVQIDITTSTESKVDSGQHSSLSRMIPISSENHRRSEIEFQDVEEEV